MKHVFRPIVCALLLLLPAALPLSAQRDFSTSAVTKLVLLGTGTPNPLPNQVGPSLAIVVRDTPYIVDFGPGVIRRAAALAPTHGGTIPGLEVRRIGRAFLTHLHSDHSVGYPDLILTPWVMGRDEPLEVYGPEGLADMTRHILKAYGEDIRYRLYGDEPANDRGWRVNSHEITREGVVYQDALVKVEAFPVTHGSWPNAWGFRFTTPDRVIVVSGDTTPCETVVKYAAGADILVHEVYSRKGYEKKDAFWKTYHARNHTSTTELGAIAAKAKPRLLVLTHVLFWGATEEEMLREVAQTYSGKVAVGRDLDIY